MQDVNDFVTVFHGCKTKFAHLHAAARAVEENRFFEGILVDVVRLELVRDVDRGVVGLAVIVVDLHLHGVASGGTVDDLGTVEGNLQFIVLKKFYLACQDSIPKHVGKVLPPTNAFGVHREIEVLVLFLAHIDDAPQQFPPINICLADIGQLLWPLLPSKGALVVVVGLLLNPLRTHPVGKTAKKECKEDYFADASHWNEGWNYIGNCIRK